MKLKLIIILTLLLGILACGVATPTPTAETAPEPVQVNAVPDVEEEKPVIVPTATSTPEPEPQEEIIEEKPSCVELLTPANNDEFLPEGKEIFSWTVLENAALYQLNFILPDESILTFESEETKITRYIEAFTQDGEYQWNVTALNTAGEEICSSDFSSFTKPETPENKPQGDDGDGNNCTVDCGPPGGGGD